MESLIDELKESIFKLDNKSTQEIKLSLAKLIRFGTELSNQFSKYYSKIHILEVDFKKFYLYLRFFLIYSKNTFKDPSFQHLHEKMGARIYLSKVVYAIFKLIICLFDINPLKRI